MRKAIWVVVLLGACGTDPLPAGASCKVNADCKTGLDCLDVAQFNGSACTVVGHACSITCTTTADCASLGSNFMCFGGCGSAMFCGKTL